MQFGRIGMTRPEKFPKKFNVYRYENTTTDAGRIRAGSTVPVKKLELRCILSVADPDEVQRFSQMVGVVTHTIFHRGHAQAKKNDVFRLVKNGKETREFRVQAIRNSGEMDIDTTYYCEERGDIKCT